MKMFTGKIEWKDGYRIVNSKNWFKVLDKNNNEIYWENSKKSWIKREYDKNGNQIYWENSNKYWIKIEYDKDCNIIYDEDSRGEITDNRPKLVKELTVKQIEELLGYEIKIVK